MANRWSQITDQIRGKLPHWWKMRRKKESVGAQFLNVFGLTLEDVQYLLNYALNQRFINTADEGQVDIIYKGSLPGAVTSSSALMVTGGALQLDAVDQMSTFLTGRKPDNPEYIELFYDNPFYIDWDRKLIYVRNPYTVTAQYPEGSIRMLVLDSNNTVISDNVIPLRIHHVWNFFDEFGLLLDTPRLYGERNKEYKNRILDVFRHPANASYRGLMNGIARELSLRYEETWLDDSKDHTIYRPRVIPTSIEVDGNPLSSDRVTTDRSNRAVLLGAGGIGATRIVSYIAGLDGHALHNKQDYAFQDQLYTAEGTATGLLQHYVDQIAQNIPVMWGQFTYGNSYWDIASPDMSGVGFIPTVMDGDFSGWQSYTPKG